MESLLLEKSFYNEGLLIHWNVAHFQINSNYNDGMAMMIKLSIVN